MARVLVAMSGGVDSSVAAACLLDEGHDVTGVTLKLWGGPSDSGCCSVADVEDARRVAAQLGIPHYVFNLTDAFDEHVVGPYVDAYAHARTPNPCVECNRSIKFGALFERMNALGFDALATGHHARVVPRRRDPARRASRAVATARRTSRTCSTCSSRASSSGCCSRSASSRRPRCAPKPSDAGCAPRRRPRAWTCASSRAADAPSSSPSATNRVPARSCRSTARTSVTHDDAARFTIGQRRGTGVAAGERRFVVDIDATTATITLGRRDDLLRDCGRARRR